MQWALVAAYLSLMVHAAFAHGPAQWIQDGNYKNAAHEMCCGEADCGFYKSGTIEHTADGYEVDADFQVEYRGTVTLIHIKELIPEEDATPSPTGEYWACSWGGKRRCFFVPPGLM